MIYVLGGGSPQNYKVVGGTSAPSDPKENTIWVNTSTAITSHVFSATQPTGSAGMVWMKTGTSSKTAFNALKKNNITVYPTAVKQYVSGKWVDKTAKSYIGGKWVAWWNGELYQNGDEFSDVTGGWESGTFDDSKYSMGTATKNATSLYFSVPSSNKAAGWGTKNKINLTNYNTLKINVTANNFGAGFEIYVDSDKIRGSAVASGVAKGTGVFSVDISKLTASYYIFFQTFTTGSSTGNATVNKVWLE